MCRPRFTNLESEERMQCKVFNHVSCECLEVFRQNVLNENVRLLTRHLAFALHQDEIVRQRNLLEGA